MKKVKCYEVHLNYNKFIFQEDEDDEAMQFATDAALRTDGDVPVSITVITEDEREESV